MATSAAAEGVTVGGATIAAGPAFVGSAITTAGGLLESAIGAYGIYTFMTLPPLQSPSNDSSGGGSDGSDSSSGQQNPSTEGSSPQGETPVPVASPSGGYPTGGPWIPVSNEGMQLANNQAVMGIIQDGKIVGLADPNYGILDPTAVDVGISHLEMANQLGIDTAGGVLPQGVEGFFVANRNGVLDISGPGVANFNISPSATTLLQQFFQAAK